MAVYEDALVRKINSEAKPSSVLQAVKEELPAVVTQENKKKRKSSKSVTATETPSFDRTQTTVRTAPSSKRTSSTSRSSHPFLSRTPVSFTPLADLHSSPGAYGEEDVRQSRPRTRVVTPYPRTTRHHAKSRSDSIPSGSPRRRVPWQSSFAQSLLADISPLKPRRVFKGRLDVSPKVLTPRVTRSGKQIGFGRFRIQTW